MNKILNRLRQIITRDKECNYGTIGKKQNKKELNKSAPNTNKNKSNKVRINKWGFPVIE